MAMAKKNHVQVIDKSTSAVQHLTTKQDEYLE